MPIRHLVPGQSRLRRGAWLGKGGGGHSFAFAQAIERVAVLLLGSAFACTVIVPTGS